DAATPPWPLTAEERVLDVDPGLAEERPDSSRLEGVTNADLAAVLPQQLVRGPDPLVGSDPEHPLGGFVMRRKLVLPVAERAPLLVAEKRRPGPVERVGVPEASAPDSRAGDDEDVLECGHPEDAAEAELRHPEVAA